MAVISEWALVAETVGAGLTARGLEATSWHWPPEPPGEEWSSRSTSRPEVGLMVVDLGVRTRVHTACRLIAVTTIPWVVVTQSPEGPSWGAVLESGAWAVLPGGAGLADVCSALGAAADHVVLVDPDDRTRLVALWADQVERRGAIQDRMGLLTPREHEVLTLLHGGDEIARIAALLDVSPVTVRSQVKAVLRKLGVRNQLGAVAALDELLTLESWAPGEVSPDCGISGSPVASC